MPYCPCCSWPLLMMMMLMAGSHIFLTWFPSLPESPYQGGLLAGSRGDVRASPKISKNNNTIGQAWPQQTILPTTTNHNGYHRMPTTHKESEKAFSLSLNSTPHRAASERRTTIPDKQTDLSSNDQSDLGNPFRTSTRVPA